MTGEARCVGENETFREAARQMASLEVGALPICGEDDRLKGMVTDRDIVVRVHQVGPHGDRFFDFYGHQVLPAFD
jgi:CBS domain-containing protein